MVSKTISVELKKKTIQSAVNQIDMLRAMDMGKHREGDAMFELVKEIKFVEKVLGKEKIGLIDSEKDIVKFRRNNII